MLLSKVPGRFRPMKRLSPGNGIIVEVGTGMDSGALGGCGGDIDSAHVVVGESSGKGNE